MTQRLTAPDFLVIGHVCRDCIPEPPGSRTGGTVFYAAKAASLLGCSVGIVTAGGPEVETLRDLPNTVVVNLDSTHSTSFENVYTPSGRRQFLRQLAPAIPTGIVPAEWRKAPIVLLGPVASEVSVEMARLFPRSLVALTPQGLLRELRLGQEVRYQRWNRPEDFLDHCSAIIVSEEDLAGHHAEWITAAGPIFILTRGDIGCEVIYQGKRRRVPGFQAAEEDPTGAGDVFAAAFLIELGRCKEPLAAARFGNFVASLAVSGRLDAIGSLEDVEQQLRAMA